MEQEANTVVETIGDAMTAADLVKKLRALKVASGPRAEVHLIISSNNYVSDGHNISLTVRPTGEYGNGAPYFSFNAPTWAEAFSTAEEWASTYGSVSRNATIRRMALAVIEITDEHSVCTEKLLRGKSFTAAEIVEFHEAACVRAGEMCSGAPFSVVFAKEPA